MVSQQPEHTRGTGPMNPDRTGFTEFVTPTLGFPVVPLEKQKIAIFVFPSPGARRLSSKQAGLASPLCTSASIVA